MILSLGSHPCAYVEVSKESRLYGKHYDDIDDIGCHGGLTYCDNCLQLENNESYQGWFIGWDYAHYGDLMGDVFSSLDKKQWTTGEIIEEVKAVIDQIIAVDKPD